jgi:hypothetical protein
MGKKPRGKKGHRQENREYKAWEDVKTNASFIEYYRLCLGFTPEETEEFSHVLRT